MPQLKTQRACRGARIGLRRARKYINININININMNMNTNINININIAISTKNIYIGVCKAWGL